MLPIASYFRLGRLLAPLYPIVECMIRSRGLVWHLTKSFQKGERLNHKLKMKICKLGDVCKQTSLLRRITDGNLGPKPQLLGNVLAIFLEKKLF